MPIVMGTCMTGDRFWATWRDKPRGKDMIVRALSLRVSYPAACFISLRDLLRSVLYLAACLISLLSRPGASSGENIHAGDSPSGVV